jgi:CHAT domain-containing protein/tetratricopeptide (TPR) repeat protein
MTKIYTENLGEPALALAAAEQARQLITARTANYTGAAAAEAVADESDRLARLYQDLGRPIPALEAYDKAVAYYRTAPTTQEGVTEQGMLRDLLTRRAGYLTALGDYEAALRDWDDVQPLIKATLRVYRGMSEPLQRAQWLGDVARTHSLAGHADKALALAREGITEVGRESSNEWVGANFVESVVGILVEANVPDEAIAFCTSYFKRLLSKPVPQPVVEKYFFELVARAEVKAGRFDEARSRLLAAADIDKNHPTAEIGGLAASLLALGNLEIAAGNYARAKEHLVAARAAVNPYDLNRVWQIERALARAFSKMNDGDAAASHYESALTTLESVREQLRPEEFRAKYGEPRDRLYEEFASLLAATAAVSGQQADGGRAFEAAERKRTQMLRSLLATGWLRMPPEAVPEQVRRLLDVETRIGAKQSLLRAQFDQPAAKRNTTMVQALQRELERLQAEHSKMLTGVAQGQYRYAAPATLAASLAGPVRAALGSSRALVEYLVTDDRTYAFVVSAAGVKVVPLAVGRAALRRQVQQWLAPFRQLRSGEVDLSRLGYDTNAAFALYRTIFAPVRSSLGSAFDIVIVPDDILHFLPFDALLEKAPRAAPPSPALHGEFAGYSFLLRRYAFSYVTSAASLLADETAAGSRQAPRQLFAMANPTASRPPAAQGYEDPLKRQLRSGALDAFLAPLPGAEVEVQRIARYFARETSAIFQGAQATEATYDAQAGQSAIVHFATHAVASDGQPLYSTLVLAPDSSPGHDGFLQAYEVLRTPLQAKLVVLSGCETALGAEDWGQGLVGLVAAFEQAGARSVLATLWSIDEAAAEVMSGFYAAMAAGMSTPAALRQAKLQLLKQRVNIGKTEVSLAHPFFWAPFILVGAPTGR